MTAVNFGSLEQAAQLLLSNTGRIVPHYLKDRNIFSGDLCPFTALIDPTEPKMGPGQQPMRIPGSRKIQTRITRDYSPRVQAFGKAPTTFECGSDLAALTADTNANLTLASTKGLRKYSTIRNRRTGAVVQVQSVTSTTVVVVRGFAGGTGGLGLDAHQATDRYDSLGDKRPDGSQTITGLRHDPTTYENYLSIMVKETDLGWVGEKMSLRPDETNGHETNLMINARQHQEERERNFLFGELRSGSTSINGEYITASKGLDAMSDIEYDAGGVLTMDELRFAAGPEIFSAGGGGRKMGLAGNTFLSVLDTIMDGKIVYDKAQEAHTVSLRKIGIAAGQLEFMASQPMHEREGTAIFYDPDLLIRFVVEGFDMAFFQNKGPSDYLFSRDLYMTVETILSPNPQHIAVVTGVLQ